MKFVMKSLALLLVGTCASLEASAAEDTCATFQEHGWCYNTKNFYVTGDAVNGTRAIIEASQDATAASVYDQFVEPLIDIAMEIAVFELQMGAFCYGAFDGERLKYNPHMQGLGCSDLPMKSGVTYGTLAGQMPIPNYVQQALVPLSLWTHVRQEETITPTFCMGLRVPTSSCSQLTFGTTLYRDAAVALTEVMPSGGVGEAILSFIAALHDVLGIDPVTFAFSLGSGLDVQAKYFTDRKFIKEDFHAHLYFTSHGPIELPFVKEGGMDIIKIDGPYQRGFHLADTTASVEVALKSILAPSKMNRLIDKSEIINYMESAVGGLPEVISTTGNLTVNLAGITRGLFDGFTVSGSRIQALKLSHRVGSVPSHTKGGTAPAGFYVNANVEMDTLQGIAACICNKFEGALLAVAGTGCPSLVNFNNSTEGKLGLEIRAEVLELVIAWPNFFLRCKVHDMETDKPKMNCQVDDIVFGIKEEDHGYIIGKSHALTGEIEEQISVISKDAVKEAQGFKKKIVVSSRLSSEVSPKAFAPVAKYFGGDASLSRDQVSFGFLPDYKCKSTHRLWSSRARGTYKHHFSQAGLDDSKASCLLSCYEWHIDNPDYDVGDLCCSHEAIYTDSNECRVGHKGRQGASDKRKSASITFVVDFEKLENLPVVGARCETGQDCFSQYCHNGVCKHECSADNQCFASPWSKCFGSEDACLNINGARHYCDRNTDSCACDESSGPCKRHQPADTTMGLMKPTKDDKASERRR